ncbi:MarR family transcriptional regulator [Thioclava sp. BHET1]|nr:MarR family transcriptional regulator [Thioclava sp. BHET1]
MTTEAEVTPGLQDFLCFSVYAASHAFNRVYKPLLDELGLTYPQYLAMIALWAEDGLTVSQLGERLFLESNTLTPMLKRLESLGYVHRKRDSEDERVVRISLSESGRALQARAGSVPQCVLEATGLTVSQLRALGAAMRDLRANLAEAAR